MIYIYNVYNVYSGPFELRETRSHPGTPGGPEQGQLCPCCSWADPILRRSLSSPTTSPFPTWISAFPGPQSSRISISLNQARQSFIPETTTPSSHSLTRLQGFFSPSDRVRLWHTCVCVCGG